MQPWAPLWEPLWAPLRAQPWAHGGHGVLQRLLLALQHGQGLPMPPQHAQHFLLLPE